MKAEVYGGKASLLYSAWYGRHVVSLKYREDMNYITVDGCSSQEKEEKERKVERERDSKGFSIGMSGQDILQSTLEP